MNEDALRRLFEMTQKELGANAPSFARENGEYMVASTQNAWAGWVQCCSAMKKAGVINDE